MNDEELKKEIESALAVAPSTQFVARVRQQLASEPRRRWVTLPWKVAAAGLAAAAVVAGIVLYQPREVRSPEPVAAVAIVEPTPGRAVETAPTQRQTLVAAVTPKPAARRQKAEPEVLFDPREAAGFRSLLDDVDQKKIDPAKLAELFEGANKARTEEIAPMPIAGLEPIVIRPLNIAVPDKEGGSL